MKRLAQTYLAFLTFGLALSAASSAYAADKADMTATLISCSNTGQGIDSSLQKYERHLKRLFKFDSYQQRGIGRSSVNIPGSSSIRIGGGHTVSLEVTEAGNDRLRIDAKWTQNGKLLTNITVSGGRNHPIVLGGPQSKDGVLILLLVAR